MLFSVYNYYLYIENNTCLYCISSCLIPMSHVSESSIRKCQLIINKTIIFTTIDPKYIYSLRANFLSNIYSVNMIIWGVQGQGFSHILYN